MYSFLDNTGNVIKTRSVREFSDRHSLPYKSALSLASGRRARLCGYCSTHPRAKKLRERFTTTLLNLKTGERKILGPSVKKFAKDHDLSLQGLSELVNRRVLAYIVVNGELE